MGHANFRRALAPAGSVDTAVRRVADFFDAHADGLCSLVEALGQDELLRVFDAALDASSSEEPNGILVARALELLSDGLAGVAVRDLDVVANRVCRPTDPYAALSWYGARLSDLSREVSNSLGRKC